MPDGSYFTPPTKPDPAFINSGLRGRDDNTYLHELAERGAPASYIAEAVQMGARLNTLNRQKMPPLGLAILRGEAETVKALIDAGAELYFEVGKSHTGEPQYFNAAMIAALSGSREKLDIVLANGGAALVNLGGIDADGYDNGLKPLHAAIKKWKQDVIPQLVDAGAFVDETAGRGNETPLMAAIMNDSEDAVQKLVRRGASLEARNPATGDTPLIYATGNDRRFASEKLIALGADVNAANNKGRTPLMQAAAQANKQLVEKILALKPDINARDADGQTALMLAAQRGSSEVVTLLLKAGADPLLTDSFNKSARAYAASASSGYRNDYYYERTSSGHTASWILEEAEKSALQKGFEQAYDRMKSEKEAAKKPPAAKNNAPGGSPGA